MSGAHHRIGRDLSLPYSPPPALQSVVTLLPAGTKKDGPPGGGAHMLTFTLVADDDTSLNLPGHRERLSSWARSLAGSSTDMVTIMTVGRIHAVG